MTDEKINLLLEPFLAPDSLSPEQIRQVQLHLDLLLKWNAKVNLTAVRTPEEIVQRHFGESFFAARQLTKFAPNSASAVDVGSGAGFPGLPLKIWDPQIKLTLVESNQKKVAFLHESVRVLRLSNTEVFAIRAEELKSKFGIVTLRAVERFDKILPVATRLLQASGVLGLLIGNAQVNIAKQLLPHLVWNDPIPMPLSEKRVSLIGRS